jgi:hypothetical protein
MATLFTYLRQTQRFLREARQELLNPEDLIEYINQGRREVAARTQCIRRLTPISGQIVSASVVNAGSGYTAPTVSITPPDFPSGYQPSPGGAQATAGAVLSSGTIASVTIGFGGYGYFQPIISIVDPTGTGASISPSISQINLLTPQQEVYPFSSIYVGNWPGVDSVYMIKSVSIIYSGYRYSIPIYDFTQYQARVRNYPYQYQFVPTMGSQFGQGTDGSFYLYPLPSQVYQVEFDCFCLPQDLTDNQSVDVVPQPWSDTVAYWAAYLGFSELGNLNAAKFYLDSFDNMTIRKGAYARAGRAVNPYGRY